MPANVAGLLSEHSGRRAGLQAMLRASPAVLQVRIFADPLRVARRVFFREHLSNRAVKPSPA